MIDTSALDLGLVVAAHGRHAMVETPDGERVLCHTRGKGRRKEGDQLADLFDGPAFVAARQRVPLLPVGIGGSDKAMPIGAKFVFPRKVVIVIGEPIYPDVPLEGRVSRSEISALTERLRADVQAVYDEAQAKAASERSSRC